MSNDMTVKKLYTEEYIRDTANAIRLLTGSTDSMKVSEFAEAIRTYAEPNDLTNVHKVKVTIHDFYSKWNDPITITEIEFVDVLTGERYTYGSSNDISTSISPMYQEAAKYNMIDNVNEVNAYNNNTTRWDYNLSSPLSIEISFEIAIDLTRFNIINIYAGTYGSAAEKTSPKTISVDVKSGTSDFYTRIINKRLFGRITQPTALSMNINHNKYRYIRYKVLEQHKNIEGWGTPSNTYTQASSIIFKDNEDNVFTYPGGCVVTSCSSSSYSIPGNYFTTDHSLQGKMEQIDIANGSDWAQVALPSGSFIDLDVYTKMEHWSYNTQNYDDQYQTPKHIKLLVSNDSNFTSYKEIYDGYSSLVRTNVPYLLFSGNLK